MGLVVVVLLVWNEVYAYSSARKRALRERRPFEPRPYIFMRWPFLLGVLMVGGLGLGNPLYGIWLFLIVKCLFDLLGYAIDMRLEEASEEA